MCSGISLSWRELPQAIINQHRLQGREIIRQEGADREFRFMYRDHRPLIPAWFGSELCIFTWGGGAKLPKTGWLTVESLEEGRWRDLEPEPVEVPATFGFERGIWFQVRGGLIRGVLVRDEADRPHIYLLTQPSSHYFQVMTRSPREPVFVGEQI